MDHKDLDNILETIERVADVSFSQDSSVSNVFVTGNMEWKIVECGIRIGEKHKKRILDALKSENKE